jgi:glycosyltransferase involved in cell wall biosynthesis
MKIALIGYEANIKNRVGSNQYAFELMKALYELDQKNQYTIFLPTPPLPDLPPARKNWQYKIVGPRKFWNFCGLPLALFRQKPQPEVVFNPGHYCPLFFPSPLVVSIMDLGYLRHPEHFTSKIYWKLKIWTALSMKRAKHLLTISQSTKNDIIKYYQIDSKKITVAYPGYDKNKFKIQKAKGKIEEVKKKYKIKGNYILFLSTLKPSKNIEGLLAAYKILITKKASETGMSQYPHVQLVIAGKKGWLFAKIFAKVKALGLKNKVIFTDFVEEEEVPLLMSGAKVFVLPSFWEGFGIPVVEAMACGTPVVVSKVGSLPEIVDDMGVIVDPYDPNDIARGISEVLHYDTAQYHSQMTKGIERAKKFSWEECARKTIKVLEKVGEI